MSNKNLFQLLSGMFRVSKSAAGQALVCEKDLVPYLQRFGWAEKNAADKWAHEHAIECGRGEVLFWLREAPSPGALRFFSFRDVSMVVDNKSSQPTVLNLTRRCYEPRTLESVMKEFAQKAIFDSQDLFFVKADPIEQLSSELTTKIEKVGGNFVEGGTRTSQKDPAKDILSALGANLPPIVNPEHLVDLDLLFKAIFDPALGESLPLRPVKV